MKVYDGMHLEEFEAKLVETVKANPGSNPNKITKMLGSKIHNMTIKKHLKELCKKGILRNRRLSDRGKQEYLVFYINNPDET
jgi:predicted HTH transcriptional regulator